MCCQRPDEGTSIYWVDGCFTAAINKGNSLGLDLQGAPGAVHLPLKWPRQLLLRRHVCVMGDALKARGSGLVTHRAGIKMAPRVPPHSHLPNTSCAAALQRPLANQHTDRFRMCHLAWELKVG